MLERFEPRRQMSFPLKQFRDDFAQMMSRFFDEPFFQSQTSSFIPAINVKEETEQYVVEAELPGMDMKDVDIEINGNILTLRGERKQETEKNDKQTHITESSYGAFRRSFTLPDHVDMDQITAESKKGILYIRIPKDQTKQTRKIDIQENMEH